MKPSPSKNLTSSSGRHYAFVELGDVLFFGGSIQKYYEVDNFRNERCFSGDVDLIQLYWDTKIVPIVLEKEK